MEDSPRQTVASSQELVEAFSGDTAWTVGLKSVGETPAFDQADGAADTEANLDHTSRATQPTSVREWVAHGISNPRGFPPLGQAVIPDDRVVLAVDATLPDIQVLIGAVIEQFESSQLGSLDVVLSEEASDDLMMDLANAFAGKVVVSRHASAQRDSLMYLVADPSGNPVYLNRKIVDADFVLPLVTRFHDWADVDESSGSLSGNLFPLFADSASQRRYRRRSSQSREELTGFAQNLGMTLGIQALLVVSADDHGQVVRVDCGSTSVMQLPGDAGPSQLEADVVVGCIDGGDHQQTWTNLGRAASVLDLIAQDDATVVLWSSMCISPPAEFFPLAPHASQDLDSGEGSESDGDAEEDVNGDGFPSNESLRVAASQLAKLCERCRVMIRTSLDDEIVEELGVGVIHGHEELRRMRSDGQTIGIVCAAQFLGARAIG